jgi:ATP-binding cassette subfamily C protein LapB
MANNVANPNGRTELALLLSKLAALLGHAVPSYRFSLLQKVGQSVDAHSLGTLDLACELWKSCFERGQSQRIALGNLEKRDFPLLWISSSGDSVCLVRGRLSTGRFSAESANGQSFDLDDRAAQGGTFVRLWNTAAHQDLHDKPRNATQWFAFAMRKHRRVFLEGVFATLLISVIGLAGSMYTMQVYDRVVPTGGYSTLWVLTIGVLIAITLEAVMKMVRSYMVDRSSKAIDLELSGVFFGKAMSIRMDARPNTVGTFASQIRYFESVRNFIASSTLFVLADAPFAIFFIFVIAAIAGPVAMVPAIALPIAVLSGLASVRAIDRYTKDNMQESNRKNGLLIEALDGIEAIKASGGEWKMQDKHRELTETIAYSDLKLKDVSSRAQYMAQTIQQLNYIGMIAVGAYVISTGQLSMGGLIASSIIAGRALTPIAQIPSLIMQWKHAKSALDGLNAIMEMPSDRPEGERMIVPEGCTGHLRMEDVGYSYRGEKPDLQVQRLEFKPGERVAIIGSVGSGKSTLIKVVSGLFKPQSGAVFLDGIDMMSLAPEFVREHVGYLPQDVRLFGGTLRENLSIGLPTPSDSVIMRAAALTGLDQAIRNHPKGLELEIAEGGHGLSGGQRQLVGLTRTLIARPRVLLMDEPTASMDGQLESKVMKHVFEEMPADSSVIVVTHKLSVLTYVDRVIVVDKGGVVVDGPKEQVMERIRQGLSNKPVEASKSLGVGT